MISIHDIIAFIEYELSFQSLDSADPARTHPAGAAGPWPGRHGGPDGIRHHRWPEETEAAGPVRSERVT